MKPDIKRFREACKHLGMTDDEQEDFSDYIHAMKLAGEYGTGNSRGDFTWKELLELGSDFLDQSRQ